MKPNFATPTKTYVQPPVDDDYNWTQYMSPGEMPSMNDGNQTHLQARSKQ